MKAAEIIAKLEELSKMEGDDVLCARLEKTCPDYERENPADVVGAAALWNELGSVCRRNAWFEKGEKAFCRGREILEEAGIVDGNYATTLNNLAGLYRLWGNHGRSFELFSRCRELYASMPDLPVDMLASCCNNLGLLYLDKKEFAFALGEFSRAEAMIAAIPENYYVHAVTAGNSAYAYYGLGDTQKAAENMLRAARFAEKLEGREGDMYKNYMGLYRRLGGREQK